MNRLVMFVLVALLLAVCLPLAGGAAQPQAAKTGDNPLLNPKSPEMTKAAPATFKAKFVTSKGDFTVEVTRAWAPRGADRFYNLVNNGFFNDCRFFRVVSGFMVQFGINGDPKIQANWRNANFPDDPVKQSNTRGMVTFATSGPNSRSTQVFINYNNANAQLDKDGFAPFGKVIEGMEVVDKLFSGYGESPDQTSIQMQGNTYLKSKFPNLDYVKTATIVQ
jgi:peptidyl-prolyl cis-trans isomerase A (cyclophilin A)